MILSINAGKHDSTKGYLATDDRATTSQRTTHTAVAIKSLPENQLRPRGLLGHQM